MNKKLTMVLILFLCGTVQAEQAPVSPDHSVDYAHYEDLDDDAFINAILENEVIKPEVKIPSSAEYYIQTVGWKILNGYWYMSSCVRRSLWWTYTRMVAVVRHTGVDKDE